PNHPLNAYLVTHHICGFGLKILGITVDAENIEDLYADTPCVYVGNHQNVYDVFVYGSIFPKYAFVIGKKSLKWVPFFGWVYALSGNLYIDRKDRNSAISTMTATEEVIRNNNKSLFVFPEGTRSRGKGIGPFKKGAFHVALNTKRPVVGMVATKYDFNLNKWKSGTVGFKVLKPYYITSTETLDADIENIHRGFVDFQSSYKNL
ncbi:MAG: 1-acyl-sn-glycerol-3-phosphate acyltransferase, partial [Bdellovibrionales bacterium]|nr:1-acyl-sn-glycerol-3-phosphate acyltransferase [Bdellovibrionales bacterium]